MVIAERIIMVRQHEAQLIITAKDDRRMIAALKAVTPEIPKKSKGGHTVFRVYGGSLFIRFEADTVAALRALVNSYLRWLSMIDEILDVVENNLSSA
jgi:tRNA threonylcarbamoyladenosine modification (KEOPS) complex  Pcc1 subunit